MIFGIFQTVVNDLLRSAAGGSHIEIIIIAFIPGHSTGDNR